MTGGEAKIGKTWVNLSVVEALATGANLWNHPGMRVTGEPRVGFIEQEVNQAEMEKRICEMFQGKGRGMDRLWCISHDSDIQLDTMAGQKRITELIGDLALNVVIFDPIGRLLSGDLSDEVVVNRIFQYFSMLIDKFEEQELSIMLSHHARKNGQGREKNATLEDRLSPYNFRGSSLFFNSPDQIITFARNGPKQPGGGWRLYGGLFGRYGQGLPPFVVRVNMNGLGVEYERDAMENEGEFPIEPPAALPQPKKNNVLESIPGQGRQANLFKP